jgi:hypothetical protein
VCLWLCVCAPSLLFHVFLTDSQHSCLALPTMEQDICQRFTRKDAEDLETLLTSRGTSLESARYVVREGELSVSISKMRRRRMFVALFNDCLLLARVKFPRSERLQLVAHWPLSTLTVRLQSAQLMLFFSDTSSACAVLEVCFVLSILPHQVFVLFFLPVSPCRCVCVCVCVVSCLCLDTCLCVIVCIHSILSVRSLCVYVYVYVAVL